PYETRHRGRSARSFWGQERSHDKTIAAIRRRHPPRGLTLEPDEPDLSSAFARIQFRNGRFSSVSVESDNELVESQFQDRSQALAGERKAISGAGCLVSAAGPLVDRTGGEDRHRSTDFESHGRSTQRARVVEAGNG